MTTLTESFSLLWNIHVLVWDYKCGRKSSPEGYKTHAQRVHFEECCRHRLQFDKDYVTLKEHDRSVILLKSGKGLILILLLI